MNLLALDTSSAACSASLMLKDKMKTLYELTPRGHSDLILTMCDQLLAEEKLLPSQLDGIAFGRGPGSFTGLRIASGVTQGIAFSANLPIIPISSLAALAHKTHIENKQNNILVAMDAKMQEVYWGAFKFDAGKLVHSAEGLCQPSALPIATDVKWFAVGDAWTTYQACFSEQLVARIVGFDTDSLPSAENIAYLAQQNLIDGKTYPPEKAVPVYLRNNVAKKTAKMPS